MHSCIYNLLDREPAPQQRISPTGVCENNTPFYGSLRPTILRQRLRSSPRFGALNADIQMCIVFQR